MKGLNETRVTALRTVTHSTDRASPKTPATRRDRTRWVLAQVMGQSPCRSQRGRATASATKAADTGWSRSLHMAEWTLNQAVVHRSTPSKTPCGSLHSEPTRFPQGIRPVSQPQPMPRLLPHHLMAISASWDRLSGLCPNGRCLSRP